MAEKARQIKIAMKMVSARGHHRSGYRRNPPEARVLRTGRTTFNVAGTEDLNDLAQSQGLDLSTYNVALGYDEENGYIGVYPVPGGTPGSVRLRRNVKERTVVLYLYDIFDAEPSLRPLARRNCELVIGTDENGMNCLLVGINSSLRVGTSKTSAEGEGAKAPSKKKGGKKASGGVQAPGSTSVAAGSQTDGAGAGAPGNPPAPGSADDR